MACGLGSGDTGGRRARARGQEAAEGCTGKERSVGGTVRVTRRPCHVRFQPRPFSSTGPPRASTSPRDVVDHLEFRQRPYVRYRSARNHATTLFVELPLSRSAPSPRSSSVKLAAARVSLDRQEIIRGTTYRARSIVATRYRRPASNVPRTEKYSSKHRETRSGPDYRTQPFPTLSLSLPSSCSFYHRSFVRTSRPVRTVSLATLITRRCSTSSGKCRGGLSRASINLRAQRPPAAFVHATRLC